VEAVMQSTLSSQIAGRVLSLNVKAGDRVKAGQVLATIDDRETQTGVLRSQAQLQQSDAELRQLQIALKRTQDLKTQGLSVLPHWTWPRRNTKQPKPAVTARVPQQIKLK
jgi:multidrug efflux pump subunit AcrA (membrane-fusion protein)